MPRSRAEIDRPLAGALLAGGVEDQVDQRLAGLRVAVAEDVAGDLDQVAVERPLFQRAKTSCRASASRPATRLQQVVGLADELHVAVLDAVVDHLDVMAGPLGADPVAARRAVGRLGGDGLEDRLDVRPGRGVAAGHDRRAEQRPFLAAGDARADEQQPAVLERPGAPGRVGVMGVAAVDQDVARLEQRGDLLDHLIDGRAGLDHDHDLARPLQRGDQLLDGVAADDLFALGPAGEELVDPSAGAVEHGHGVAVALHVQDEVFAHDGQADQADVRGRFCHPRSPLPVSRPPPVCRACRTCLKVRSRGSSCAV